jgi:hypothetical protein
MEFDDFCQLFNRIQLCHMTTDAHLLPHINFHHEDGKCGLEWNVICYHDEWLPGKTAGGCGNNNEALFWTNPQFMFSLNGNEEKKTSSVLISLVRKYTWVQKPLITGKLSEDHIQFRVYRILNEYDVDFAKRNFLRLYANQLEKIGSTGDYDNSRVISKRFNLPSGSYLVVPSCYDCNRKCEFVLRVFTENPIKDQDFQILSEHKHDLTYEDLFFFEENSNSNMQNIQTQKFKSIRSPVFEKFVKFTDKPAASSKSLNDCCLM